ncbi:MAG TPA: hypothetical protein VEX68_20395 [Bryobacteraceae bacterium]|nr:hypothetical protein [Bryobacteraceae bacterium]
MPDLLLEIRIVETFNRALTSQTRNYTVGDANYKIKDALSMMRATQMFATVAILLLTSACTSQAPTSQQSVQLPQTPLPTLQSATVRFEMSNGDNKNKDTHLALAITKEALAIARIDDFAGDQEFGDPGNYGPFSLIVQPGITKEQYRGSTTRLTVAPSGQDRVILNTLIDARFSDGDVLTSQSGVLSVDQDNRILEFKNP